MAELSGRLLSLGEIKAVIDQYAAKIEAPSSTLPTYGHSEDFARPHIESDHGYHFVVVERGQELERRTTWLLDNLLYEVFSGVTHDIASRFAAQSPTPKMDFRRAMFEKQLELLARLEPRWRDQRAAEIADILRRHPFSDKS